MQSDILRLPQDGKTTRVRILTRTHPEEQAARCATHIVVAREPEPRTEQLAALYKPRKVTHATVQYVDVGGLQGTQKDRARDTALLAPLREVDAIAHVLRVFDDPAVPHAAGSIDPLRDATNLELELILSDLDQIARRLERLDKDLKKKKEPALEHERHVLERCKTHLESEKALRELDLPPQESKSVSGFLFLSQRPMLYVLNLGDNEAAELSTAVARHRSEERRVGKESSRRRAQPRERKKE